MSRSRRNKKRRVTSEWRESYNQGVTNLGSSDSTPSELGPRKAAPSAEGRGAKDFDPPAVPSPDPEPELCSEVRVFSLDESPQYLHSISEWLARDAITRGEATLLRTSARVRGIQYVRKSEPDPVTPEKPCPLRTDSIGDPHSHDTPLNPRGVWTFDPYPTAGRDTGKLDRFIRRVFSSAIDSCLEKTKAA